MFQRIFLTGIVCLMMTFVSPNVVQANFLPSLPDASQSVNSQGEVLRNKQGTRAELQQNQVQLLKEIDTLLIEIQDLERQERELENRILRLEDTLSKAQEVDTESSDQAVEEQIASTEDSIKLELDQAQLDLIEVGKELADKKSRRDANRDALASVEEELAAIEVEVDAERSEFLTSLAETAREYAPYVVAVIVLMVSYGIAKRVNNRYASPGIQPLVAAILRVILVFSVGLILLYMFVGQLGNIITLLSVFSAALVVALQDFVSSFFAWIFIKARGKFKEGDIIKVASVDGGHYFFGRVKRIEAFRTLMTEVVGDGDFNGNLDKERPTGRIVSIPNNTFLKQPIVNATQDGWTVWQSMDVIITFDSDWKKAKVVLQEMLADIFTEEFLKERKISKNYHSRVLTSIAGEGVRFSLWFPARVGGYREVLEVVSEELLTRFKKEGIVLAYNTLTVEMKK